MSLLKHFNVEISISRLNQILFLLEKTKLILCKHYGDNQYYAPLKFKKAYIDYNSKQSESSFQRERTKAAIWAEIQKNHYRKYVYDSVKAVGEAM